MLKKSISILVVICMLLTCVPALSFASEAEVSKCDMPMGEVLNARFFEGNTCGFELLNAQTGAAVTTVPESEGSENYVLKYTATKHNDGATSVNGGAEHIAIKVNGDEGIKFVDGRNIIIETKFKKTAETARLYFKYNINPKDNYKEETANLFTILSIWHDGVVKYANGTSTGDNTQVAMANSSLAGYGTSWVTSKTVIKGASLLADIYLYGEDGTLIETIENASLKQPSGRTSLDPSEALYIEEATHLKTLSFRGRKDATDVLVDYVKVSVEEEAKVNAPAVMPLSGKFDVNFDAVTVISNVADYFKLYNEDGTLVEDAELTVNGNKLTFDLGSVQAEGAKYVLKVDKASLADYGYVFEDETTDYEITASAYYVNADFGAGDNGGFELLNNLEATSISTEPIAENSENYVLKYSAANHTLNGTLAQGGDEHIVVKVNGDAGIEYKENQNIVVEARFKKNSENGRVYFKHNIKVNEANEEGYNLFSIAAIFNGTSDGVRYPEKFSAVAGVENLQVGMAKVTGYATGYNDKYLTVKAVIKGNTHKADLYFYDENGENETIIKDAELGIPTGRENNVNDTHLKTLAFRTRNAATDVYVDYVKVSVTQEAEVNVPAIMSLNGEFNVKFVAEDTPENIGEYFEIYNSLNELVGFSTVSEDDTVSFKLEKAPAEGEKFTVRVNKEALGFLGYNFADEATDYSVKATKYIINDNFGENDLNGWALKTSTFGTLGTELIADNNYALKLGLVNSGYIWQDNNYAYKAFDDIAYEEGTDIVIKTKFKYTDDNKGTADAPNTTCARTYFKFNVPETEVYGKNVFSFFEVKADNGFAIADGNSTTATGEFTTEYTSGSYKDDNKANVENMWFDVTIKIHGTTQTASIYVTDENKNVVVDAAAADLTQDATYTDFATDALKNLAFRLRHDLSTVLVDYVKVYKEKPVNFTVPEIIALDGELDVAFDMENVTEEIADCFKLYDDAGNVAESTVSGNKISYALGQQTEGTKYVLNVDTDALANMGYAIKGIEDEYEITASAYYVNANFGANDNGGFELLNNLEASSISTEAIEENSENYVLKYQAANHTLNGTLAQGGDEHIVVKVNGDAGIEYKENQDIIVEARFKKNSESGRVYFKHNIKVNEANEEGYNLFSIAAIFNGTSDGVRYPEKFSAVAGVENLQVGMAKVTGYATGYNDKYLTVKAVIKGNTHKADLYFYDENGENETIIKDAELGIPTGRENNVNDTHLKTLAFRTRNAATDVYVDYVKVYKQTSISLDFDGKIIDKNGNMYIWADADTLDIIYPHIQLVDSENKEVEIATEIMGDGSVKIDPIDALEIGTYTLKVDTKALEAYAIDESEITVDVRDNTLSYSESFEDDHEWVLNTFSMGEATDAAQTVEKEGENSFLRVSLTKQKSMKNGVTTAYKFGDNGFVMDSDGYTVIEAKLRTNSNSFRKYFKFNTDYDNGFFANTRTLFALDYPEAGKISYFALRQNIKSENASAYYQGAGTALEEYAFDKWYTVRAVFDNKERTGKYYMLDENGKVVAESEKISMNDSEPQDFTEYGAANWYNFADHNITDREQLRYIDELAFVLRNTPTLTEAETLDIDDVKLYNTKSLEGIVADKATLGLKKDGVDFEGDLVAGTYYPKADIELASSKDLTLIAVLYNGDTIENMVAYPFNGSTGEVVADKALVIDDATDCKIKLFLWNSLEGMAPVCGSLEFH